MVSGGPSGTGEIITGGASREEHSAFREAKFASIGRVPDWDISFTVIDMAVRNISVAHLYDLESGLLAAARAPMQSVPIICSHAEQSRRWTVTFPNSNLLAIGEAALRFPTHDKVFAGALYATRECPEHFPRSTPDGVLNDNMVCGFIDGNNYIIRIEDHSRLISRIGDPSNGNRAADRVELDGLLRMYEKAIEINAQAARDTGGEIVLLLMGENTEARLIIPKMLGRLHQTALQPLLPGPSFIRKSIQRINAGEVLYAESQRMRFITPSQTEGMQKLLEDPNPEVFLRAMTELQDMLIPKAGKKVEARFLVVDPITESPIQAGQHENSVRTLFTDLVRSAINYRDHWSEGIQRLKGELQGIASVQRAHTHPKLAYEDLTDAEYVRIMCNILRTGGKEIDFGKGFSTPLKAVEIGYFKTYPDGTRQFSHSFDPPERLVTRGPCDPINGQIVNWAMKNVPGAPTADWLALCKPEIALTFDHHPSAFVNAFGDIQEKSYVVLVGNVGEPEQRIVVRENQYGESMWKLRQTEKVEKLLKQATPRELTYLVELFQNSQNDLCQTLSRIAGSRHSTEAEQFKAILRKDIEDADLPYRDGDLMYRRFYDGERLDLVHLTEWTRAQIEGGLVAIGEVIAKSIIKQSPSLDFSGLVITKRDPDTGAPLELLSLSSSETFCNSLRLKDKNTYLRMVESLYASHVATWIESFFIGEYGGAIPASDRPRVRAELRDTFLESFQETLLRITSPVSRAEFSAKLSEIKENYVRVRREFRATALAAEEVRRLNPILAKEPSVSHEVPTVLDMPRTFGFTEELLAMTEDEIDDYVRDLSHAIDVQCKQYEDILGLTGAPVSAASSDMAATDGEYSAVRTWELQEDVLFAVYSLTNNHFSADKFARIDRVISAKEFDLAPYSLQEKIWLFNFIDVAAWLDEIKFPHSEELLNAATQEVNAKSFLKVVNEQYPGSNLPAQSLSGFYHAVFGLLNLKDTEGDTSRKRTLRRNLLAVQDILGTMRSFRSAV